MQEPDISPGTGPQNSALAQSAARNSSPPAEDALCTYALTFVRLVNVAKAVGDAEATVKRLLQKPKFLPHEFIDAAAENIDLTAKLLLLNRDSMRWLVANCHALLAKPSRNGS